MAFTHGKNSVFKVQNSAGTLTDISAFGMKGDLKQTADTPETTTFGAAAKSYIGGLPDGTFAFDFVWDGAAGNIDATLSGILGALKNFEFHPAGTAVGNPKYTGSAILKAFEVSSDIGDVVKGSCEFQCSGAITRGVN